MGESFTTSLRKSRLWPHMQDRQGAALMWHPSCYVKAKIEKCHDATKENDASSNTPRVCSQAKSRHTQGLRERGDTSVKPRVITSEVKVSIWLSTCDFRIKFVYMKDESSPNLVSKLTDYARGRLSACQNDVYSRRIGNASKYYRRRPGSSLHHP